MGLVLLVDNSIVLRSVPTTFTLSDSSTLSLHEAGLLPVNKSAEGIVVSNFTKFVSKYPQIAYEEGWVSVVDNGPPEHDKNTQFAKRTLVVVDNEVHAVYSVEERSESFVVNSGDHYDPQIGAPA